MLAVVLAGGLGTRLRNVVKDLPKPMANIGGKPFLEYLLFYLSKQNIRRTVLSVGYKYEAILNYFGNSFQDMKLEYVIEKEPLGTGGAIKKVAETVQEDEFLVLNGDTLFNVELKKLVEFSEEHKSDVVVAVKYVDKPERYGTVVIDNNNRIVLFREKGASLEGGYINGGIYVVRKTSFLSKCQSEKFSFERDFLEAYYKDLHFHACAFDEYFIDIGVPEDYERAQRELPLIV
uniref:D-glycero-D-manno-heptose 1-phosphate guanosyltransferase n=1 Tax=Fervidobacterium pennivorans TaxID=93466 RepID=A0A7V4KCD1_FERPE